jgi:hypothetical protein
MNRSLWIPAICYLFVFAALTATLHGVAERDAAGEFVPREAAERRVATSSPNGEVLLSPEDAEKLLTALVGEYVRPWRKWEASPHRLYSRVAPRPIPTIVAKVEMSPCTACSSDKFLVAKIDVSFGGESKATPCVVDRTTSKVLLFADGQWLAQEEWLKNSPLP